ncbi:MAG: ZIP family metal transporter [Kiritimatiellae bacterium]|nr:ZIP family metal transporter [Kiritimatiellia bacterium]
MNIILFKAIAFVSVLLTGIAGGIWAERLGTMSHGKRFFSFGNAFAGGIFLGAGLLHMFPDAQENVDALALGSDFPWVSLICALGFLFILFLEKVFTNGHDDMLVSDDEHAHKKFSPYILTLVLSIHSIIAGIALGTEDVMKKASIILIAVVAHKGSAAFALTVNLCREGISKATVRKVVVMFSFMTPLGIILGLVLSSFLAGRAELLAEGIFDALAAGTFLYVALMDILQEEFNSTRDKSLKFALVLFGFGVMAVLAIFL